MMYSKQHIINILQQNSVQLRCFGLSEIGLFGSYVKNEETENSDIDILVEFELGKKNFDNFMNLSFYLDSLFQTKIDVVTEKSLREYMKEKIMKEVEYVPLSS
jgi:uncharacterized protein